jgi:hypothetical protein
MKTKIEQLKIIISNLPKKYKKITVDKVLESKDEKLQDLKAWCIEFNKYQINNGLNSLKNESNFINISNSFSS